MKKVRSKSAPKHLDVPVSNNLPFAAFADDEIVLNKDGCLLSILEIEGIESETLENIELNNYQHILTKVISELGEEFTIWSHFVRKRIKSVNSTDNENYISSLFAQKYADGLNADKLYENKMYLTLVYKAKTVQYKGISMRVPVLFGHRKEKEEIPLEGEIIKLRDKIIFIKESLDKYGVKVLKAFSQKSKSSEILTFLGELLNGEEKRYRQPNIDLSEVIPTNRVYVSHDAIQLINEIENTENFISMASIKKYSEFTCPSYMSSLSKLPVEFVLTHIYQPVSKIDAAKLIQRQRAKMFMVDDQAKSQTDQLTDALDNLQSERIGFGYHTGMICIKALSQKQLDLEMQLILKELTQLDMKCVREAANLESAFWSQFPGNFKDINRKALISSANISDLISYHSVSKGDIGNNHLQDSILQLKTPYASLFNFNFHRAEGPKTLSIGHTTIIGPSGAGKTTLMTVLDSQIRKFNSRSFIFDYRHGMGAYVLASNGNYYHLDSGKATGINPVPREDSPKSRRYLFQFMTALVIRGGETLSSEEEDVISKAIDGVYSLAPEERNLAALCSFINCSLDVYKRLKTWLKAEQGDRGYLFDHTSDSIALDKPVIGFDLTAIMGDETALLPMMLYIFNKIENSFDGRLNAILLDEGWQFLNHPYWETILRGWLATFRKENAYVVFGTQNPRQVAESALSFELIQGAATNIYLPNPEAQEKDYKEEFGLNQREFEIVKDLNPVERYMLIKQGKSGSVAKLDMNMVKDLIPVFSSNQRLYRKAEKMSANIQKPEDWVLKYCGVDNE